MGIRESEIIISRENVKPSSPTPQNLQTYKLSMLDQIVPSMLVPIILYFPNAVVSSGDHESESLISHTTETLKRSLSSILSRFYPLAGRVNNDGRSIDCNDEGVSFVVARFRGSNLSDVVAKHPDRRLLPCDVTWAAEEGPDSTVALVQVSFFDCGGAAVAGVFWHSLVDAVAIGGFIKSWAAAARGSGEAVCPNYISQSLFPHKEELARDSVSLATIMKTGSSVMRRFAFDAAAVAALKAESGVERPSRVEVVSGLIWRSFMAASSSESSILTHAVNLRRRARPPFPPECFGNWPALAAAASGNGEGNDLGVLVRKMRDSVRKVDDDYVRRLCGDGGVAGNEENVRRTWSGAPAGAELLSISSWCGFGLYDVDFGWGKPVWVTRFDGGSESKYLNLVWLMDSRDGEGVEAWVILQDKYMAVFQRVEELRALASLDPNPLASISHAAVEDDQP